MVWLICWDKLIPNVRWVIGNGRSTRFWSDNWVSGVGKLSEICNSGNQQGHDERECFFINNKG